MRRALVVLAVVAACADRPASGFDASVACPECVVVATACAAGFAPLDGGAGCVAILPSAPCDAGTRAMLGSTSCVPVGVTACAEGFERDPSGWGCRPVLPPATCTGATREKLGATACVPVGDCNAPFPPSDATLFVSSRFTTFDSTHFGSIAAALAATDGGDVIAIDEGVYDGGLVPRPGVALIGRCAARVVISQPAPTHIGLLLNAPGLVVRNLTVRGFAGGIAVASGTADVSGVVIENSALTGFVVAGAGARATLRDSVVRHTRARPTDRTATGIYAREHGSLEATDVTLVDNEFAGAAVATSDAGLTLNRAVIRDGLPRTAGPGVNVYGVGVFASDDAALEVNESAVFDNFEAGIIVSTGGGAKPAQAVIRRSTVERTKLSPFDGYARGINVIRDARARVEDTTVRDAEEEQLQFSDGATGDLARTTLFGAGQGGKGAGLIVSLDAGVTATSLAVVNVYAAAVQTQSHASVMLSQSLLLATAVKAREGVGLNAQSNSSMVVTDSTVERMSGVAVLLETGSVSMARSVVRDTRAIQNGGRAVSVQDGSTFSASSCAFIEGHETGVAAFDVGSTATLVDSSVQRTLYDETGRFGLGVIALDAAAITLTRCTVTQSLGIAIANDGAKVAVQQSFISNNSVGVHAQGGASVQSAQDAALIDNQLTISNDTRFVGNGLRVGTGTVPLPTK